MGCINQDRSIDPEYAERLHAKGQTISLAAQVKNSKFWPTPQAHDCHKGDAQRVGRFGTKHGGRNLNDEVALYPTPCARDYRSPNSKPFSGRGGGRKGEQLVNFVAHNFPTPTATNTKANHMRGNDKGKARESRNYGATGQLNPEWVEWLMGWPRGWTDLGPLNPQTFHEWLQGSKTESAA